MTDRYRYEIDEQLAVRVWDLENPNEENAPSLFQPDQPSGAPWESSEQATAWVEALIQEWLTPAPEEITE